MDIAAYLKRIDYHGSRRISVETLGELQLAHLMTVPFENLSIHYRQPITLEDAALFGKVVFRRRGGFCYELNGLFGALLRALGFEVHMLSARVANAAGEFGPEFDHMTLMVNLDQRWLVDVGFGDSFRAPLLLDNSEEQTQNDCGYKIAKDDDRYTLWQREIGEEWKPQYSFTLDSFAYSAYAAMCQYHQTSPESHFTRGRICTRATRRGRITLSDLRLITTEEGLRQERTLANEAEFTDVLRQAFGLVIEAAQG